MRPGRHWGVAAAVVQVEDAHSEAHAQGAQGHRAAQVRHCNNRHGWMWATGHECGGKLHSRYTELPALIKENAIMNYTTDTR